MIKFIQRIFLIPRLISRFQQGRIKKAFLTLRDARSAGILADLRKPGNLPAVVQFAKTLHKGDKPCHLVLIIPDKRKELNPFDYEKHFPGMPVELICPEELSIYKTPRKLQVKAFTDHTFDIVFYLDIEENFALQSVMWQSQAMMFAGPEGLCHNTLDFQISLPAQSDLPTLTENLLKYLQVSPGKTEMKPQTESFKLF